MYKKAVIIFFLISISASTVHADMFGGSDSVIVVKLTGIYNTMKETYENSMQVLNEAKAQSDNLRKISQLTKELEAEYHFVKNFSIERELQNIVDDLGGLSNLDNLDGRSTVDQLRLIRSDIDRRFKNSSSQQEREKYARLKSRVKEIERLNQIQKTKADEAKIHATEEQNEKTSLASIASSCALISSLQLAQEQRRAEEDLAIDILKQESEALDGEFNKALSKMR